MSKTTINTLLLIEYNLKLKHLIKILIILLFIISCKNGNDALNGKWVNISISNKADPLLYNFKENNELVILNGDYSKEKYSYSYSDGQIVVSGDITEELIKINILSKDSIVLNWLYHTDVIVRYDKFTKLDFDQNKQFTSYFIRGYWTVNNLYNSNFITKSYIDFYSNKDAVHYYEFIEEDELKNSIRHFHWNLIKAGHINVILVYDFYPVYIFVQNFNDSLITGLTYIDNKLQKVYFEKILTSKRLNNLEYITDSEWCINTEYGDIPCKIPYCIDFFGETYTYKCYDRMSLKAFNSFLSSNKKAIYCHTYDDIEILLINPIMKDLLEINFWNVSKNESIPQNYYYQRIDN